MGNDVTEGLLKHVSRKVSGFLAGERDYTRLEGDTGPLVYPAGFLYAFAGLQYLTGGDVRCAQAAVLTIHTRTKVVPPWALPLLCLSKRVHSIFLLRLFNDGLAMALLHLSLLVLQRRYWNVGLTLFSAAVSIKMNVLLFAPPLLLLLLKGTTLLGVVGALSCAAALQVLLGLPFLLHHPWEYVAQAFNLGRVFIHFWSVNFKFVPEAVFVSKPFALALLALHLALLLAYAHWRWCRQEGGLWLVLKNAVQGSGGRGDGEHAGLVGANEHPPAGPSGGPPILTAEHVTTLMFAGNFIGIVCARSLHYQFYSWYFSSLPHLLWLAPYPALARLALWALVELSWNIYPSTPASSFLLLVCHVALLWGLWVAKPRIPYVEKAGEAKEKCQ